MEPFYYRSTTNFGDHMNSWLWPELIPELLQRDDDIRLVGIGSLLSRNLDLVAGPKVVFSTGSGYSTLPSPQQAEKWDIRCVRGPLTARYLGLDPEKSITDGAWLINQLPGFSGLATARSGTVFVPHWSTAAYGNWRGICEHGGLTYVDPLDGRDVVFPALQNAELAIVESLHGAIIADYYRTPWIAVASPKRILKFKWLDWCKSLDMEYSPYMLPPSDYLDCLLQGQSRNDLPDTPVAIPVPASTFDAHKTPPPPQKPGAKHKVKMRARALARTARGAVLDIGAKLRDGPAFRGWNARHADRMQGYFKALCSRAPQLSAPQVRSDRIDQLNTALEKMRRDYS